MMDLGITDMMNSISIGSFRFTNPETLYFIIAIVLVLLIVLAKSFVAIDKRRLHNPQWIKSRRRYRIFMFITRALIFSMMMIALADPYGEVRRDIPGDLTLHVLIDNSTSLNLFDTSFTNELTRQLSEYIPTKTGYIAAGTESRLGDGILNSLEKNKNILLITDGQNNVGTDLLDVLVYASSLISSMCAINLDQQRNDVAVEVKGPSKTIADVENKFRVKINKAGYQGSVRLIVGVDTEIIYDETTDQDVYEFARNFSDGWHKIVARIVPEATDHFPDNNVFYKTTHVIEKPQVLFVTKAESAMKIILDELYDVTQVKDLPTSKKELEKYYAVIANDLGISNLKDIDALQDFVIEGNGLLVVGGYNSFDNGGYQDSAFESILPVNVGSGEEKKGDTNIAIVMDLSGTFAKADLISQGLDPAKAMAVGVMDDINEKNNVGVVAFTDSAYKVADVEPLFVSKGSTTEKISRLQLKEGQSEFNKGLRGAFSLLRGKTGSNNVIFISDGFTWSELERQKTEEVVRAMRAYGIKLFVIGMGKNLDEKFMKNIANVGGGVYFTADSANKLKILFGEPEKKQVGSAFDLFVLDPHHFITEDLELSAVLYGYNQVVPKSSARMLVTSDSGEPAIVVWRYGIGRAGTLTVFSSGNNLGELLDKENSRLLTRTINWVIGDPERKNPFFIDVTDARVNKTSEIIIRSQNIPKVSGLKFSKIGKDTYRSYYVNDKIGFRSVLGAVYGVNYDKEYQYLGLNDQLSKIVKSTGGQVFDSDKVENIVQHVKTVSKRTVSEKKSFRDLFLMGALILLMLEIIIRRIRETWFR